MPSPDYSGPPFRSAPDLVPMILIRDETCPEAPPCWPRPRNPPHHGNDLHLNVPLADQA